MVADTLRVLSVNSYPPDVGAIDANSAMDNMTKNMQQQTTSTSHIAPAVPPFPRLKTRVVRENSHVSPRTTTKPTTEKKRNRR